MIPRMRRPLSPLVPPARSPIRETGELSGPRSCGGRRRNGAAISGSAPPEIGREGPRKPGTHFGAGVLVCLVCLSTLSAACDDGMPPPPPPFDGGPRDAGVDAGPRPDSGPFDAGPPLTLDAGPPPTVSCAPLDTPPLELGRDTRPAERQITLLGAAAEFGVAWVQSPAVADEVRFVRAPSRGTVPGALIIANPSLASDVAATRRADGSYLLLWDDNSHGPVELSSRRLGPDGLPLAEAVRVTNEPLREQRPSLVATATGAVATWTQIDGRTGVARAALGALTADGAAAGAPSDPGFVTPIAVRRFPSGPAVVWNDAGALYAQPVDDAGALTGAPLRLDSEGNAVGLPRVASVADRAGLVYVAAVAGVSAQVRFVPLDDTGAPSAAERVVSTPPNQGTAPAVVALGGGYVVAYRELGGGAAVLRYALLDPFGNRVGDGTLATTSATGGSVEIAAAGDGRFAVAWVDTSDAASKRFLLSRVECTDGM